MEKVKIMTTDTITYTNYYSSKRLNFHLVHELMYKKELCNILCEADTVSSTNNGWGTKIMLKTPTEGR